MDQIVELHTTVGEDYSCQMFWTDDYGEPYPITDPVLLDVRDANHQIALRFATTNDPASAPVATYNGPNGFFQFTAPSACTILLQPGRYVFDLFATVVTDDPAIPNQIRKVVGGDFVVDPRHTKIEEASSPLVSISPGG